MNKLKIHQLVIPFIVFLSCSDDPEISSFELQKAFAGSLEISLIDNVTENIPIDRAISLEFSDAIKQSTIESGVLLTLNDQQVNANMSLQNQQRTLSISTIGTWEDNAVYTISLNSSLQSDDGAPIVPITFSFKTMANELELLSFSVDGKSKNESKSQNISTQPVFTFDFSTAVDIASFEDTFTYQGASFDVNASNDDRTITVTSTSDLDYLKKYSIGITDGLTSSDGGGFDGFTFDFYTQLDSTYKFPEISDEELLTKVQEQTFKYFWDFGHPNSGLARERNTSGEIVTIGGSGFGVMAILVGIERAFITRLEGVERLETIVDFLETADRFHGVWPHWMNGTSGETIPFSADDDGADLVETAFMIHGLLTARQYLNDANVQEAAIIDKISSLWESVEWDWFVQSGDNALTWHWSPNFGFQKNHKIQGWNEALIIYVLAAASPTHPIAANVYHEGWARNGNMVNGNTFYDIDLPLGSDRGGPLFFAHYSFLGLDPRNLEDQYANYWAQNVNHTLINRAYCIANPSNFVGYSTGSWGLTASDNNNGYSAHSPNNDLGVITPTAAISSIPYTPEESMEAIRYFYYLLGDKLWGDYGFYDAYNLTAGWYASSYLAIDQGLIIVMIENHRTALLWDMFMKDPEVTAGLDKLGFTY